MGRRNYTSPFLSGQRADRHDPRRSVGLRSHLESLNRFHLSVVALFEPSDKLRHSNLVDSEMPLHFLRCETSSSLRWTRLTQEGEVDAA